MFLNGQICTKNVSRSVVSGIIPRPSVREHTHTHWPWTTSNIAGGWAPHILDSWRTLPYDANMQYIYN
jgi:hypothetical protein